MDHRHVFLLDPLQIEREEVGAEAFGHIIGKPRRRAFLVGSEDPAATFLADIPFRIRIAQNRVFRHRLAIFNQRRVGLGHDILMLNRDGGDLDPQKPRGALRMVAGGGHDMLGRDHHLLVRRHQVAALLDHLCHGHVPMIPGPGVAVDLPFPLDHDTALAGPLAIAMVTSAGLM